MGTVSDYLIQAEFCKKMADRTVLIEGKARWLELASKWLSLVDERSQTERGVIAHEDEIAKAVVLALFIPLIISSGGNSGSQAATLIVRSFGVRVLSARARASGAGAGFASC